MVILYLFHQNSYFWFLRQNRPQAESPKTCPPLVETQPRTGHVGMLHISCTARNSAQFLPFWFIELHFFPALFQHKDVQKKSKQLQTFNLVNSVHPLTTSMGHLENLTSVRLKQTDVGTLLFFSSRVQWNRAKAQYWALPSNIH